MLQNVRTSLHAIYNASVADLKSTTDLRGKTVFITGAAHRLGRAIAVAMAQASANVAFTYLSSADEARQTQAEIEKAGAQALALQCEIRQQDSIEQAVTSVLDRFGQIDIVVNNAGVFQTAKFESITAGQWDDVFAVNVRGPFLMSQRCVPALRETHGRIINLGSLGGEKPWATHAH